MSKEAISECVKAGQLLSEIAQQKFRPIPRGWFSIEKFMEVHDCGATFARESLRTLVKFNRAQHKKWPKQDNGGKTYYISIYKTK
jgi:hypothetical protein